MKPIEHNDPDMWDDEPLLRMWAESKAAYARQDVNMLEEGEIVPPPPANPEAMLDDIVRHSIQLGIKIGYYQKAMEERNKST